MHPLLQNSFGSRPAVMQDDVHAEGIVSIAYASEARTMVVALGNGQLLLLDRTGLQLQRERGYSKLISIVWSDDGMFGAAALQGGRLVCFDRSLRARWKVDLTGEILGLAISPFGSHIAVSSEMGRTYIVTSDKKEICRFDTPRPLNYLQFLHESPRLIGAAEFGHLCCHSLNGREEWNERTLNNVGSLSVSGCGRQILLAAFNHGIQVLDEYGKQQGSFMPDGIPNYAVSCATRRRIAATTLEQRLYWLNAEGSVLWAGELAREPVVDIAVDALGDRLYVATSAGRLMQLSW